MIRVENTYTPKSFLNNKKLLKCLESVSEHGTTYRAGLTLGLAVALKPAVITATPHVDKENKQYAITNTICAALMQLLMVVSAALPIEYAIQKIDKMPKKFLKPETINNLKTDGKTLADSRSYKFVTQLIKLGTGSILAIPKSILTVMLIPIIMQKLFGKKNKTDKNTNIPDTKKTQTKPGNNNNYQITKPQKTNKPTFTGNITAELSKKIGRIIDNPSVQNFAKKYQTKDADIARNLTVGTSIILTGTSSLQIKNSKKIKDDRKQALIYNKLISTGVTLSTGCFIDGMVKKATKNLVNKFVKANAKDPKLGEYVEGINILRPAIVFGLISFGILPMFSTYMSQRIENYMNRKHGKKQQS